MGEWWSMAWSPTVMALDWQQWGWSADSWALLPPVVNVWSMAEESPVVDYRIAEDSSSPVVDYWFGLVRYCHSSLSVAKEPFERPVVETWIGFRQFSSNEFPLVVLSFHSSVEPDSCCLCCS